MTYQVKILGTRYIIEVAMVDHQWYVQLVVDESVEEKVLLKGNNQRELTNSVENLLHKGGITVNKLQKDKIISDLLNQAMSLFKPDSATQSQNKPSYSLSTPPAYQPPSMPEKRTPSVTPQHGDQTSKFDVAKKKAFQTGSFELQQRLLQEYQQKLNGVDQPESPSAPIQDLQPASAVNQTLDQLIISHNKLIEIVKRFDERLSYLERITGKIVEITGDILDEF